LLGRLFTFLYFLCSFCPKGSQYFISIQPPDDCGGFGLPSLPPVRNCFFFLSPAQFSFVLRHTLSTFAVHFIFSQVRRAHTPLPLACCGTPLLGVGFPSSCLDAFCHLFTPSFTCVHPNRFCLVVLLLPFFPFLTSPQLSFLFFASMHSWFPLLYPHVRWELG